MSVLKAIAERRSIGQVTDTPVSLEQVEKIIQAGAWAPNHKRTDPWRFTVFSGEGRHLLQQAMLDGAVDDAEREKLNGKAYRAPAIIAVWCAVGRGLKQPPVWEEQAAVAACCQNMLLAAHELGLGAIWRSGKPCEMPTVQKLMQAGADMFDASRGDMIIGFIYLGQPDTSKPDPVRKAPNPAVKVYS